MNTAIPSILRTVLPLAVVALVFQAPDANAQAQSLLSSNQVVVTRVEPILPDGLLITGINFGRNSTGDDKNEKAEKISNSTAPVVSLFHPGSKTIAILNSKYTPGSSEIIATLPIGLTAKSPGTYRLMVSFGSGTAATDVFEFTVGAVGLTGPQGAKGDKGDQGIQGIQGIQGLKGDKGDQGIQGIQGIQGLKGDKGDQGIQGIQGLKGDKGDQGIQGLKGDTGIQGIQGLKGDKGDQGIQGIQGPKGDQGIQGIQGLKGDKGDQGIQGIQGPKGDKGDTGATGPQGLQGPSGVTGLMSLPVFQNKPAAIAGGVAIGSFWVQEGSGQVFRMMDHN